MKKILLLLAFTFSVVSYAQEEEYAVFLENALEALQDNNRQEYLANMKIFSTAIETYNLTPDNIPKKYFDLYVDCLVFGHQKKVQFPNEMAGKARIFLEALANREQNAWAMLMLGTFYTQGYGVDVNFNIAETWLNKAIELNEIKAITALGIIYILKEDYQKAFNSFEKAAKLGEPEAMYGIGRFYQFGFIDIEQDYEKAIYWFTKSAEKEVPGAMMEIGNLYLTGEGVDISIEKGISWYQKAVDQGNSEAMYILSEVYNNLGGEENKTLSTKLSLRAAKLGNTDAMSKIGAYYLEIDDVQQAKLWLTKSAKGNNLSGMFGLGVLYQIKELDLEKALIWYRKGCELGHSICCEMIQKLQNK